MASLVTTTVTGDLTVDGHGTFKRFANYRNLTIQRAQGTSAAPTTIANNQTLGKLSFQGYTGSVYREGASIAGKVTAGVSGDEIPSSLLFLHGSGWRNITNRKIDNRSYRSIHIHRCANGYYGYV